MKRTGLLVALGALTALTAPAAAIPAAAVATVVDGLMLAGSGPLLVFGGRVAPVNGPYKRA